MTDQRPHITIAVALCLLLNATAFAQSTNVAAAPNSTGYEVIQITGLPEAKSDAKGRLTLSDTELMFTNRDFKAEIPFARMKNVSIGNERIETGGKAGQIMRKVIPYGGGMALAAVTQKTAELLTIEYLDFEGRDHGVVFFVPKSSAKVLSDRIASQLSHTTSQQPHACETVPSRTYVIVEPIASRDVELPAEYRVLLYEGIVSELHRSSTAATYTRASSVDIGPGCAGSKLKIIVTGFKKGNRALRAATGPIGLFVGKTSVSFHVELTAADGHSLMSEDMTSNNRMDSESLGIAKSVAKAVSKKIRKLPSAKSVS